MEKNIAGTATGCYKCGKLGHWSRDCPFSSSDPTTNPNPKSNLPPRPSYNSSLPPRPSYNFNSSPPLDKTAEKPKKQPRTRPKLTPELLLSDDGLGYVLRHFPRAFKFGGRGHEVSDLGNLIGLYSQWHSRLLPYYSFEQFIHKVEQVGATRRVRTCLRDLRERVANGGDPSKLHEAPVEHIDTDSQPVVEEANNLENPSSDKGDPQFESHDAVDMLDEDPPLDDVPEEMLNDLYNTEDQSNSLQSQVTASQVLPGQGSVDGSLNQVPANDTPPNEISNSSEILISEEQKARIEANRRKALERATARVLPGQSSVDGPLNQVPANDTPPNETSNLSEIQISEEQKARIEANRRKALERAAARDRSLQAA